MRLLFLSSVVAIVLFGLVIAAPSFNQDRASYNEKDFDPTCPCIISLGLRCVTFNEDCTEVICLWNVETFIPITHPPHYYRHKAVIQWYDNMQQPVSGALMSDWIFDSQPGQIFGDVPTDACYYSLIISGEMYWDDLHYRFFYNSGKVYFR